MAEEKKNVETQETAVEVVNTQEVVEKKKINWKKVGLIAGGIAAGAAALIGGIAIGKSGKSGSDDDYPEYDYDVVDDDNSEA